MPTSTARRACSRVIAGPAVMSAVPSATRRGEQPGLRVERRARPRRRPRTTSAPTWRANAFTTAPPARKFATICAVTSCGHGVTPWACTPWSPAKTATAAGSGSGGGHAPAMPARATASSPTRPSAPRRLGHAVEPLTARGRPQGTAAAVSAVSAAGSRADRRGPTVNRHRCRLTSHRRFWERHTARSGTRPVTTVHTDRVCRVSPQGGEPGEQHRGRPHRRCRPAGDRVAAVGVVLARGDARAAAGALRRRVRAHRRRDAATAVPPRPRSPSGEKRHRAVRRARPGARGARAVPRIVERDPARLRRRPAAVPATAPTCWSPRSCAPAATRSTTSTAAPTTSPSTTRGSCSTTATRATRVATDEGEVDTERQRKAVTSYRSLIDALLHGESHQNTTATTTEERTR